MMTAQPRTPAKRAVALALRIVSVFATAMTAALSRIWAILFPLLAPFIDFVATKARPVAMVCVVLPLSFVVRNYTWLRDALYGWVFESKDTHEDRIKRISDDVCRSYAKRQTQPESERRYMCTARAPWQNLSTRFASYKASADCIFVGDLRNIIGINHKDMTVTLEPQVDVETITRYLVPRGYMLATTLEIKEATIGGLAMAVGMTTASHKYGLLQETVTEFEVVLGDGRIVKATPTENSDLYHTLPWSHGSLALLVGLTLKIIPVKKYVRVDYDPVVGMDEYCAHIREVSLKEEAADFVEATVFNRDECVIMQGTFVDSVPAGGVVNHVGLWYKKWFYTHVRDSIMVRKDEGRVTEYIPTFEYIFRHDRGIFWTLDDQLPEAIGNNVLFRYLFGWLCPPLVSFLKLPATNAIKEEMMLQRVYQDIVLPLSTLEEAISKAGDLFEIWPILVYPSRIYDHKDPSKQGLFRAPPAKEMIKGKNYAMFYDLGVYGIPEGIRRPDPSKPYKAVTSMREMEEFTSKTGGAPFLYADTFMDRKEFGQMFDLSLYEKVRKKYCAEGNFIHVYNKTSGCQSFDPKEILEREKKL